MHAVTETETAAPSVMRFYGKQSFRSHIAFAEKSGMALLYCPR